MPNPQPGQMEQRMERVSFAWTATTGYKHYPSYVNLTGNRLAIRGPEKLDGPYPDVGDYVAVELPPCALAELTAALTRPTPDGEIGELVGKLRKRAAWQRENRGDMLTYGDPDPELAQAATALETQAADIARLREALERIAGMTDIEADFDGFEAREIARLATRTDVR